MSMICGRQKICKNPRKVPGYFQGFGRRYCRGGSSGRSFRSVSTRSASRKAARVSCWTRLITTEVHWARFPAWKNSLGGFRCRKRSLAAHRLQRSVPDAHAPACNTAPHVTHCLRALIWCAPGHKHSQPGATVLYSFVFTRMFSRTHMFSRPCFHARDRNCCRNWTGFRQKPTRIAAGTPAGFGRKNAWTTRVIALGAVGRMGGNLYPLPQNETKSGSTR